MNKEVKLYKIPTYNLKKGNYIECNLSENKINNELKNDESYHIQYKETDNILISFDIDHVETEEIFNSILKILIDYFDIEDDEISFTKSIKESELSYHVSIPKYYVICNKMKETINIIKNMNPNYSKYFDISVYKKSNIFRLPYQTNKEKKYIHNIIQGYPIDFIFNHTGYFSNNYYESDI